MPASQGVPSGAGRGVPTRRSEWELPWLDCAATRQPRGWRSQALQGGVHLRGGRGGAVWGQEDTVCNGRAQGCSLGRCGRKPAGAQSHRVARYGEAYGPESGGVTLKRIVGALRGQWAERACHLEPGASGWSCHREGPVPISLMRSRTTPMSPPPPFTALLPVSVRVQALAPPAPAPGGWTTPPVYQPLCPCPSD